ncbi:MAG TPA: alkaline phosphatase family protein [Blastocatellia bacterium]|nr:alkaline phosphatase family protein [Blastocatellia bacterium]
MKILVIGLDAATLDLIEPWAREGRLPAIASLMNEGFVARLLSTPNMHSASAWTSILTGLNPGRHGLFVFSDRNFKTQRQEFFTGGDRTGQIVSSYLERLGLKCGFLNVPMTYPASGNAGSFMISGLDAPELNDNAFWPRDLRQELLGRFPAYRSAPEGLGEMMRSGDIGSAARAWTDLISLQTEAAKYLLSTRSVDFFMIVYTASDWAGHNLWNRPDSLRLVYESLDIAVSELLTLTDSDTQIYLISDHGMGRHSNASYQLPDWLCERGVMARSSKANNLPFVRAKDVARRVLPQAVKNRLKATVGAERVKRLQAVEKDAFYDSIDWPHTVAYSEAGRHVININLEGRNPSGVVKQSQYDEVCDRVINELRGWKDSHGTPVVESVGRRRDLYSGPFVERASDLFVYWNPHAQLGEPPAEVRAKGFWWAGDHRPDGLLIMKGPGIRRSAGSVAPNVCDLVPTILAAAGGSVPEGLDGKVIADALSGKVVSEVPATGSAAGVSVMQTSGELTEEEQKLVEEKLRSLGYM